MRDRIKGGRSEQEPRNNCNRPYVKLLVAQWDKDPAAIQIDVSPVDLSDGACPFCGSKTDPGH